MDSRIAWRPVLVAAFFLVALSFLVVPAAAQETRDPTKFYRNGRDLEDVGRIDEANKAFEEAVAICRARLAANAADIDSYVIICWSLNRLKRYEEVIQMGKAGLKYNEKQWDIIEIMGESYFYLKDFDSCLKMMALFVNTNPRAIRSGIAYFFMAEVYRLEKKLNLADIAYAAALELEPSLPLWWYRQGLVLEQLDEKGRAKTAFERAISLKTDYQEAKEALARVRI